MTEKELQANIERLEELGVSVTECDNGYELESYTSAGGDMFISVFEPSKEEILDYLDNFDINNEVLGWWEHGVPGPGVPFDNIRDHYNDVEEWVIRMKDIAEELEDAFYVQDSETGTHIDTFDTMEDAVKAIAEFIESDKQEGSYKEDFYEIRHYDTLYDERGQEK